MLILSKKAGLTSLLVGVILNLVWLPLASAETDCTIQSDIPQAECETLLELYDSTNGETWTDSSDNLWNATDAPCGWAGITCTDGRVTSINRSFNNLVGTLPDLSVLTDLQTLTLAGNQLSGPIPNLDNLSDLQKLSLENNQLSGPIPDFSELSQSKLIKVQNVQLGSSDNQELLINLDYNKLTTQNAGLIDQVISSTQTVAPTNIVATVLSASEVKVEWMPIFYTADGGYYQVKYATSQGGPYTPAETTTSDKTATSYIVENLSPNTSYYFVVETYTPAHGSQPNALTSKLSVEVSATLAAGATDCTIQSDIPQAECETLLELYNNTNGETWTDSSDNLWKVTNAPCGWAGITCTDGRVTGIERINKKLVGILPDLSVLTGLQTLTLAGNQLNGPIPNLDNLSNLQKLDLENNQLSGPIPDFTKLSQSKLIKVQNVQLGNPDNQELLINLDYNKLTTQNAGLIDQVISSTQTVAPTNIVATVLSASEVKVEWTPIFYTADGGYYQVKYATSQGGPYTSAETTTSDKTATSYVVENLSPNITYYFVVETYTPAHGSQQNALTSKLSVEVSATLLVAGYSSVPAPNSSLDLGSNKLGNPITASLIISEVGENTLEVSDSQISGAHASDFQIISGVAPFSIVDNGSEQTLLVQCTPSEVGLRTAILTLTTNDPNYSSVTYSLICTGEKGEPAYDSVPPPGSSLTLKVNDELGNPTSSLLTVFEVGADTLEVLSNTLSGDNASDFSLSGGAPFSIQDNGSPHNLFIQCLPVSEVSGDLTATLTLTTNDPERPTVAYSLICDQSIEVPIITGKIQAHGEINSNLSIDMPERFKLTARIQPATQHINQPVDIIIAYHWTPPIGNTPLTVTVTLAKKTPLQAIEMTLFEGTVIGLPGVFKLDLGYRLENGELFSTEIIQLKINANRKPTDILLDGDTVAENSPPDTLIGTFSTLDEDQDDWFIYGLIENPGQHFKIVSNELRVSNALSLDFESQSQYEIKIRSVDASGDYLDKSFTIQVTNEKFDISLTSQKVPEQSAEDTIVGRLVSNEPGNYQYRLLDDADGRFWLDNNLLRVAKGKLLDFETQFYHDITVRAIEATITNTTDIANNGEGTENNVETTNVDSNVDSVENTENAETTNVDRTEGTENAESTESVENTENAETTNVDNIEDTENAESTENAENALEKTFRIDIVNVLDILLQSSVRDTNGNLIELPLDAEEIQVSVQLIPDMEHRGLEADIICLANYIQEGESVASYVLDNEGWYEWDDKYLLELPIIKRLTLEDSHNLQLFQGALTEFAGGEIKFYVGYRLVETGAYVYQQESVDIMVNSILSH